MDPHFDQDTPTPDPFCGRLSFGTCLQIRQASTSVRYEVDLEDARDQRFTEDLVLPNGTSSLIVELRPLRSCKRSQRQLSNSK